jgi:hypothetical protein
MDTNPPNPADSPDQGRACGFPAGDPTIFDQLLAEVRAAGAACLQRLSPGPESAPSSWSQTETLQVRCLFTVAVSHAIAQAASDHAGRNAARAVSAGASIADLAAVAGLSPGVIAERFVSAHVATPRPVTHRDPLDVLATEVCGIIDAHARGLAQGRRRLPVSDSPDARTQLRHLCGFAASLTVARDAQQQSTRSERRASHHGADLADLA